MNDHAAAAKAEIDRLTRSFFALFSNRDGVTPDLDRIFDLFVPEGIVARCDDGRAPEISSLRDFITPRQKLLSNGALIDFAEVEISERTSIFGGMAQRLSTYQKSGNRNGVPFSTCGVKSFQFIETQDGWRILSMIWDDEREGPSMNGIGRLPVRRLHLYRCDRGQSTALLAGQQNGGPTQTMALGAGSPAIDGGESGLAPPTDQRGNARNDGNGDGIVAADISAYEAPAAVNPSPVQLRRRAVRPH